MERSTQLTGRGSVALIDELVSQQGVLAQAQARNAALMLEFSDARRSQDRQTIAERKTEGHDPRYRAGEFAAMEIALAMRASKHTVQRTMSMARRLQQETPDAWDCWQAGDIDHDKAIRINRALRRLPATPRRTCSTPSWSTSRHAGHRNCWAAGSTNSSPGSKRTSRTNGCTAAFRTG